ncbi:MAG: aminotransferase class III-fold pyridoxal phosphate-dependent enzyme, partial [Planktomarina sp.]
MKTGHNVKAPDYIEGDQKHHLHPWEDLGTWRQAERFAVTHGEGIYLYDHTGRKLIDGPAGMWAVQIGYGRQEMADAISAQVMELPYASPWFTTTSPAARLAEKVAALAPGDLNNVMFTTGGSTAVDTAIRTMHFMNNRLGRPEKKIVLSREKGYHGST